MSMLNEEGCGNVYERVYVNLARLNIDGTIERRGRLLRQKRCRNGLDGDYGG